LIIALNHKSNLNKEGFNKYQEEIKKLSYDRKNNHIIICPTYLNIPNYNLDIDLGAQNVSSNFDGPFTGEVTATQLKSYNVKYSIIGHSERRSFESNEEIIEKAKRLLEENITPILCIGENKEERENNQVISKINNQLESIKENLSQEELNKIIIAYEPIWAIGTGIVPTNDQIKEVIDYIKDKFNNKVLYGGSVNQNNVEELIKIKEIDGFLIGSMGLYPEKLQEFINKLNN